MRTERSFATAVIRLSMAVVGLGAMVWAVNVIPVFWSQNVVVSVANAIRAGEAYKPDVLEAIEARIRDRSGVTKRPSMVSKLGMIQLRIAEDSFRTGNVALIDRRLDSLARAIDEIFFIAPNDPFFWLVRFWLDSARSGLRPAYLRFLKMSYDLGPNEAWIALKRNRFSLNIFPILPGDLAELAASEFAKFVQWGLVNEAAALVGGPGLPIRPFLYERLRDLKIEQRRQFARVLYQRELDDVLVPGVTPPRSRGR